MILEQSREYLVVWRNDGPVIQSKVKTYLDPDQINNRVWMWLAALAEETDPQVIESWDLYLVIPYPEKFYV